MENIDMDKDNYISYILLFAAMLFLLCGFSHTNGNFIMEDGEGFVLSVTLESQKDSVFCHEFACEIITVNRDNTAWNNISFRGRITGSNYGKCSRSVIIACLLILLYSLYNWYGYSKYKIVIENNNSKNIIYKAFVKRGPPSLICSSN